jgi:hypothetical protein
MAKTAKTVRDIHRDAIGLKAKGIPPKEVAQVLLKIGRENGYHPRPRASDMLVIVFDTGEEVYFDASDSAWHHRNHRLDAGVS